MNIEKNNFYVLWLKNKFGNGSGAKRLELDITRVRIPKNGKNYRESFYTNELNV